MSELHGATKVVDALFEIECDELATAINNVSLISSPSSDILYPFRSGLLKLRDVLANDKLTAATRRDIEHGFQSLQSDQYEHLHEAADETNQLLTERPGLLVVPQSIKIAAGVLTRLAVFDATEQADPRMVAFMNDQDVPDRELARLECDISKFDPTVQQYLQDYWQYSDL